MQLVYCFAPVTLQTSLHRLEIIKLFTLAGYGVTLTPVRPPASPIPQLIVGTPASSQSFFLYPCPIRNSLGPSVNADECYSLMPTDRPGWFVRVYNTYLFVESWLSSSGPRSPAVFNSDASFFVHRDSFYPGFNAIESARYDDYYIRPTGPSTGLNAQLAIGHRTNTTVFFNVASFSFDKTQSFSCAFDQSFSLSLKAFNEAYKLTHLI
jgi:Alpha-L-arabinofuranosidase B (ABFB) domain